MIQTTKQEFTIAVKVIRRAIVWFIFRCSEEQFGVISAEVGRIRRAIEQRQAKKEYTAVYIGEK